MMICMLLRDWMSANPIVTFERGIIDHENAFKTSENAWLFGRDYGDSVKLVCKSANLHQFRVLGQFLGAHAMKYSLVDRYLYKTGFIIMYP